MSRFPKHLRVVCTYFGDLERKSSEPCFRSSKYSAGDTAPVLTGAAAARGEPNSSLTPGADGHLTHSMLATTGIGLAGLVAAFASGSEGTALTILSATPVVQLAVALALER